MSKTPFPISALSDVEALITALPATNTASEQAARARQDTPTKPPGSLGRLEDLASSSPFSWPAGKRAKYPR